MKYFYSAIIYFFFLCLLAGALDALLFQGDFLEGFFPINGESAILRWVIRIGFVIYFTLSKPIKIT